MTYCDTSVLAPYCKNEECEKCNPARGWEHIYRNSLEEVLDEYFPKIEEDGEARRDNKRGAAVMLYSEAVILAMKAVASEREAIARVAEELLKEYQGTSHGISLERLIRKIQGRK